MRTENWVLRESIKTIANAPIPIITFLTVPLPPAHHHIRLDISFEGPTHNGLATNALVLSLIHEFPPLRPLVLLLKTFLITKGFGAAYTGGLSSYALLLLVTRYLQEVAVSATTEDLGALLTGFFDMYANRFDPRVSGISVMNRCFFNRLEQNATSRDPNVSQTPDDPQLNEFQHPNLSSPGSKRRRHRSPTQEWETTHQFHEPTPTQDHKFDPLFVEDPLGTGNNIGRNCFRVTQIRRAFASALEELRNTDVHNMTSNINGVLLHPNNKLRNILL